MGFSRQEYWSGLPFSSPQDLPDPESEPGTPVLQADSLLFELQGRPSGVAGGSAGKELLPAIWETWVQSLGWEDALEKGTATHSSILAGDFHELYSPWGHRFRHD